MKTYTLLIFAIVVFAAMTTRGQTMIDTKRVFQVMAARVSSESSSGSIDDYSTKIARMLPYTTKKYSGYDREKEYPAEREAAILLFELQSSSKPRAIIENKDIKRYSIPTAYQAPRVLNAEELLLYYMQILLVLDLRDRFDPLVSKTKFLSARDLTDAIRNYGGGSPTRSTEERTALLLIDIKKQVDEIGVGNVFDNPEGVRLFFPLCLFTKGGC